MRGHRRHPMSSFSHAKLAARIVEENQRIKLSLSRADSFLSDPLDACRAYNHLSAAGDCHCFCILPFAHYRTEFKMAEGVKRTRDTNSPSKDGSRGVRSGISRHSRSSGSCLIELSRGSCFAMRNIRLRRFCFFRNENPRAAFVYNPTAVFRRNTSDCLETHEATLCGSCRSCWFA